MKTKGSKYLKIAGFIEIVFGIVSVAMTLWILSQDKVGVVAGFTVEKEALGILVSIYAIAGLRIIAGLFGMIFSNNPNKSGFCKFLGAMLIIIEFMSFNYENMAIQNYILYFIILIVPVMYLYGAIKNKKA